MLVVEGFQKFSGIPFGISRIFESLLPQQIGANRYKNRSIQVKDKNRFFGWDSILFLQKIINILKKIFQVCSVGFFQFPGFSSHNRKFFLIKIKIIGMSEKMPKGP